MRICIDAITPTEIGEFTYIDELLGENGSSQKCMIKSRLFHGPNRPTSFV